jgi:hypothetical protein
MHGARMPPKLLRSKKAYSTAQKLWMRYEYMLFNRGPCCQGCYQKLRGFGFVVLVRSQPQRSVWDGTNGKGASVPAKQAHHLQHGQRYWLSQLLGGNQVPFVKRYLALELRKCDCGAILLEQQHCRTEPGATGGGGSRCRWEGCLCRILEAPMKPS